MSRFFLILLPILLFTGCDGTAQQVESASTNASSNIVSEHSELNTSYGMVVTANPHATNAGIRVLEAGGSAIDAAVAIEAVLSLVEPQSSGLGGGGFMLHYDAKSARIDVYDGRETAPSGATADMFLQSDGNPMGFLDAKNSGLSIGVPGMVSMLAMAHSDHGVNDWPSLFEAAIELAESGFEVSPRLHGYLAGPRQLIPNSAEQGPLEAYQYFYDALGQPKTHLINQEYADSLRLIQQDYRNFYEGIIAEQIAAAVSQPPRAGSLSLEDIANFEAVKVSPLCIDYGSNRICGPPPPSSWIAVGMTMGILENTPRNLDSENRLQDWAIVAEASRLAYADRDQYIADTNFVEVPLQGLLNENYLAERAELIDANQAITNISFGNPWAYETTETASSYGLDATLDMAGTTHFAVVDAQGNAVALTASVESVFGSTRMAGGMLLNNQLTDFSRTPVDENGVIIANAVESLKRPRSSMSPTIVLDSDGKFLMSTGSPGGNSIIAYTLKTLVGVLDWGLTPQEAVDLPNMVARGDIVRIESERASAELIQSLNNYGFNVQESAGENSGLSVILRNPEGNLIGGVDPRREGTIGVTEQ